MKIIQTANSESEVPSHTPYSCIAQVQAIDEVLSKSMHVKGFADVDDLGDCLRQVVTLESGATYIVTTYAQKVNTSLIDANLYSKRPAELVQDLFDAIGIDNKEYSIYLSDVEFDYISKKLNSGAAKA